MIPVEKLEAVARRQRELDELLCDPAVLRDRERLQKLNKERSDLDPVLRVFAEWRAVDARIRDGREAMADPELREIAAAELPDLERAAADLEQRLRVLLLPPDPNDRRNTILEIRAGEGGEEAALFAADLFRMYARFAESRRWKVEVLHTSDSAAGGLKEVIALVSGTDVYSHLRFEAGVHRVQRVPATEAQGRIHTSTATVAVLPEADEVDVAIDEKDLKIDIAASGGPGGQGVNTTNSAVQITHVPTGIVVKCQDERSQIKNKSKAMKILRSRLLEMEQKRQEAQIAAERRTMVGSAERAQKIRTYNFPQNRITDHRYGLTLYQLDRIVEGDLGDLLTQLRQHRQVERLQASGLAPEPPRPAARAGGGEDPD